MAFFDPFFFLFLLYKGPQVWQMILNLTAKKEYSPTAEYSYFFFAIGDY
jgi:hypothetical protein